MRKNVNYYKNFKRYIKSQKASVIVISILILLLSMLSIIFPWMWGNILENLLKLKESDYEFFIKAILIYIGLELTEGIITAIKNHMIILVEEKVSKEMKTDIYKKMLSLEIKAFDTNRNGFFMKKLTEDPHILVTSYFKMIKEIALLIKIVAIIGIGFMLSSDIGIIFLIVSAIIMLTLLKLKPNMYKSERSINKQIRNFSENLYTYIGNMKEIKDMGATINIRARFDNENTDISSKMKVLKNVDSMFDILMFTIRFCMHSLVLIVGAYHLYKFEITLMHFVVLELYSAILFNSLKELSQMPYVILTFKTALKSIFDLISNRIYVDQKYGTIENHNSTGNLVIKNLTYKHGKHILVDNVSIIIPKNKKVAIVDRGGTEAKALLNLLLRHYEPTEGKIMIDDINIKDLTENSLRKNIMLISQNPFILDDTIANNIRLVKADATDEEIKEVCRRAYINMWFKDPEGDYIDTLIGKGGHSLTDSKKQQIAAARALLIAPRIVIIEELLEENSVEEMFLLSKSIEAIKKSTIILFSDKVSSIIKCDEVIVMQDARVATVGPQQSMISNRMLSNKMAEVLFGEKEVEKEFDKNIRKPKIKKTRRDLEIEFKQDEYIKDNDECEYTQTQIIKGESKNEGRYEHSIFSQIW